MRAPSRKKLTEAFGLSLEKADLVRNLIQTKAKTRNAELFPRSNAVFNACYYVPHYTERLMECLNEVLDGHGVESLGDNMSPCALYINMGDTYSPTLLLNYKTHTIRLTTWGDFAK